MFVTGLLLLKIHVTPLYNVTLISDTVLCGEWKKFTSNQVTIADTFSNEVIPNAKR